MAMTFPSEVEIGDLIYMGSDGWLPVFAIHPPAGTKTTYDFRVGREGSRNAITRACLADQKIDVRQT